LKHVWQFGLVLARVSSQAKSYSTLDTVSTWMGDRLWAGKQSLIPDQLSLAIPP